MRSVLRALADLAGGVVNGIPGNVGSALRVAYFRLRGASIGPRVRIDPGVAIDGARRVSIGPDSWIDRNAILIAGLPRTERETRHATGADPELVGRIRIGAHCHVGAHVILSGIGGLELGDEVTVAAGSKVYSLTHHYRSWARPGDRSVVFGSQVSSERQAMLQGPVRIGRNVGIAVDCLILPGTIIGADSFVRVGSVVSGTWAAGSLLAGHPARREGSRFAEPVA